MSVEVPVSSAAEVLELSPSPVAAPIPKRSRLVMPSVTTPSAASPVESKVDQLSWRHNSSGVGPYEDVKFPESS